MTKPLQVLMLFHSAYAHPRGYDYKEEFADPDNMYTENNVHKALKALGYEVRLLGLYKDIRPLFDEIAEFRPDVIFNMAEVFNEDSQQEKNIAAVLEMIGVPYTGASAGQLFICNNKALAKKIFIFHRIKVPRFYAFERGATIKISSKLRLPAIVKPLCEEASRGIAQASIVDKPEALIERVKFIHENMQMDAIVEEYIDGREFYVSILGHKRLKVLPVRELVFSNIPEGEPRIATYKAKWDEEYRKRWGIKSVAAGKLTETLQKNLEDTCKKAYRVLGMDTYMRFDVRVNSDGDVYIIEPNANPCIAKADEVALSAEKAGMSFQELIRVIVQQALQRHKKLTE